MKKVFGVIIVLVLVATAMATVLAEDIYTEDLVYVTELGELIDENDDGYGHVIRTYDAGDGNIRIGYIERHKAPNYKVEIGGEHLISVKVDHHPAWVETVKDVGRGIGEKIKGIFNRTEGNGMETAER